LGVDSLPEDLADPGKTAMSCRLHYAQVRDELMQRQPWPWADGVQSLALLPVEPVGWQFAYARPSGCLRPRAVVDMQGANIIGRRRLNHMNASVLTRYAWTATSVGDALVICCDLPDALLWFTRESTNPATWSPLFRQALVAELSVRLHGALRSDRRDRVTLIEEARMALDLAAADAGNWSTDAHPGPEGSSILARR
jgi:hypothetical protein